jgi:hypothetical protein
MGISGKLGLDKGKVREKMTAGCRQIMEKKPSY